MDPRERLVVALDLPDMKAAQALVGSLGAEVLWYKVGLELFGAVGPESVSWLKREGKRVFLDLKLHDIPNTVARAVTRLAHTGADLVDLHVAAGPEAMALAARARDEISAAAPRPLLLGVTVLTSTKTRRDHAPLTDAEVRGEAVERARDAQAAGLDGVVAPAVAVGEIHAVCGREFPVLVPGIRPAGVAAGDQRWTATPLEAVEAGARWIVVGRAITAALDPPGAARAIRAQMLAARV